MLLVHLSMMQSHDGHVSTWLHYFYPFGYLQLLLLDNQQPSLSTMPFALFRGLRVSADDDCRFTRFRTLARLGISAIRLAEIWVCTLLCPLCKWDTRSCLCAWGWFNSQIPMPSRCLTRSVFNVDSSTGQFIILSDQLIYVLCAAQHT